MAHKVNEQVKDKSLLEKIRSLYSLEKYDEAVELLDLYDVEVQGNPSLLVWKSRCLQLSEDESATDTLNDAEICLNRALELEETYLPAIIDLGYLKSVVFLQNHEGKEIFEKAIRIIKENLAEALVGLVQCEEEVNSSSSALELMSSFESISIESPELTELKSELEHY